MSAESTAVTSRPAGRPRSAEADQRILQATIDLFAERGYEGLTIEAVAERSGVAKSTIYRRWPNKVELLIDAMDHLSDSDQGSPPVLDTGSIEADLLQIAKRLRHMLQETDLGRTIPAAAAAAARHPELALAHQEKVARRRAPSLEVAENAIRRGELPATTDPQLLIDLVAGPIFYRGFISGGALDDAALQALVAAALAGVRAGT